MLNRFSVWNENLIILIFSIFILINFQSAFGATAKRTEKMQNMDKQNLGEKNIQPLPLFYNSLVPFSKKEHRSFKIKASRENYKFSENSNLIPLMITEVGRALHDYTLVMVPGVGNSTPTLAVLVGLDGKNTYIDQAGKWRSDVYIPAWIRRYPFFSVKVDGKSDTMLAIDIKDDELHKNIGEDLFSEDDNPTGRLKSIISFNSAFQNDGLATQVAIEELASAGVLEEGVLQRKKSDEDKAIDFKGILIVDEKKLSELPEKKIFSMFKSGALGLAYAQIFSMRNLRHLK